MQVDRPVLPAGAAAARRKQVVIDAPVNCGSAGARWATTTLISSSISSAMAAAGDSVGGLFRAIWDPRLACPVVDGTPAGHLAWGDGNLPLGDHLEDLAMKDMPGTMTFEPFGNGSYALDPVAAWRQCLEAIEPHLDDAVREMTRSSANARRCRRQLP